MHPFLQFIRQYTPMSNADWQQVNACLQKRTLNAGDCILEQGKICRHVWFLESGFMRYFILTRGNDVTKFFTNPPYCFTSQRSLNTQMPSTENIEALEESVIWQISSTDVNRLFELPSWAAFVRLLVQEVQFFTEEILIDLQNETAEARYLRLIEEGSPFLQKVPLKHLASYLGIAPQSLSRIRKKIAPM